MSSLPYTDAEIGLFNWLGYHPPYPPRTPMDLTPEETADLAALCTRAANLDAIPTYAQRRAIALLRRTALLRAAATARQLDLLRFIASRPGHPPTVREIAKALEVASHQAIYDLARALVAKGLLKIGEHYQSRNFRLTRTGLNLAALAAAAWPETLTSEDGTVYARQAVALRLP